VSWAVAGLLLLGSAAVGVVAGLVPARLPRRLLLAVAIAGVLVLFVPVRCSATEPGSPAGPEPDQLGGQESCATLAGWRLPEAASLDGDGPGYALSLAGAALVLGGSALVGLRRRRAAPPE
jgi:LPXTG-motif cell wall-anchored protein